jgi:hypothetical protein
LYELWHGLHGLADFENAGEAIAAVMIANVAAIRSNAIVFVLLLYLSFILSRPYIPF